MNERSSGAIGQLQPKIPRCNASSLSAKFTCAERMLCYFNASIARCVKALSAASCVFFMALAACDPSFSASPFFAVLHERRLHIVFRMSSCRSIDILQQALSYLQMLLPRLAPRQVKVVCRQHPATFAEKR